MSIVYRMDQGSADWYAIRHGIPTASQFHKILTPTGKLSTQARPYMFRLIAERLLNETMDDQLRIEWVERGKIEQPHAAAQFEVVQETKLDWVGFVTTTDGRWGCSPDALVDGRNEAVEVKCPAPWTLLGYHLDGLGADYKPQVQGQMLVGEFECVHFYAWHPRMPPFHQVTLPDPLYQQSLRDALERFSDELEHETERARALGMYLPLEIIQPLARTLPDAEPDAVNVLDAG
jgi:YqaJ-like viral recombinase domain